MCGKKKFYVTPSYVRKEVFKWIGNGRNLESQINTLRMYCGLFGYNVSTVVGGADGECSAYSLVKTDELDFDKSMDILRIGDNLFSVLKTYEDYEALPEEEEVTRDEEVAENGDYDTFRRKMDKIVEELSKIIGDALGIDDTMVKGGIVLPAGASLPPCIKPVDTAVDTIVPSILKALGVKYDPKLEVDSKSSGYNSDEAKEARDKLDAIVNILESGEDEIIESLDGIKECLKGPGIREFINKCAENDNYKLELINELAAAIEALLPKVKHRRLRFPENGNELNVYNNIYGDRNEGWSYASIYRIDGEYRIIIYTHKGTETRGLVICGSTYRELYENMKAKLDELNKGAGKFKVINKTGGVW